MEESKDEFFTRLLMNRSARLSKLISLKAPSQIVCNECRLVLQAMLFSPDISKEIFDFIGDAANEGIRGRFDPTHYLQKLRSAEIEEAELEKEIESQKELEDSLYPPEHYGLPQFELDYDDDEYEIDEEEEEDEEDD